MNTSIDMEKLREDAVHIFNSGFTCSESVIYAIKKNFELEMSDDAIAMSSGFPWGLGGAGCICGALAGGTMCIGYFYGRTEPGDPRNQLCFKLCNELHDFFLFNMLRNGFAPDKIYFLACKAFENEFSEATIKKWLATFMRRFFNQQFKRSCMPDGPKVGMSLSPRGDWRMPSDATARLWLDMCNNL